MSLQYFLISKDILINSVEYLQNQIIEATTDVEVGLTEIDIEMLTGI